MNKRWHYILISLVLVLLLPWLFSSFLPHKNTEKSNLILQSETKQTQPTETDAEQVYYLSVLSEDGNLIDTELDEYIIGVVLAEMPASFDLEALMAQAVVARTYTLKRICGKYKHVNAAVCMDASCCQGYRSPEDYLAAGNSEISLGKVMTAVYNTAGMVLVYKGNLIEATYFSCSGGTTEDAADVWGEDIPYLQSIESPGEEDAKNHSYTEHFSKDAFARQLGIELSGNPGSWIGAITYTAGGGVDTIQIGNTVFRGTQVRELLGLRSTAFSISTVGDTVAITTKGYGHRVGLSQYGAEAMAVQGSGYEQILLHYYSGAELVRYY